MPPPPESPAEGFSGDPLAVDTSALECGRCWVCYGSGRVSKWLPADFDASCGPPDADGDTVLCCICYCDASFALSRSCPAVGSDSKHYFCEACAHASLDAIRESGQFPMYCPGCRAAWPESRCPEGDEKVGRIDAADIAFLESRGIIDKQLAMRVLRPHLEELRDPMPPCIECPGKCGRYLRLEDPSYNEKLRAGGILGEIASFQWAKDGTIVTDPVNVGQCECGTCVCVKCKAAVTAPHRCCGARDMPAQTEEERAAEQEMLSRVIAHGKKCPGCGKLVEKTEGCHIMMCGTNAHGKVADALRNGGCACIFDWNSGLPCDDSHGYHDINGTWVRGKGPKTDRQVLLK